LTSSGRRLVDQALFVGHSVFPRFASQLLIFEIELAYLKAVS
jgi:hypothetical protein